MRLPYIPDPPPSSGKDEDAIVDRIRERRHPRPLQPLDLTLLHSPPVADGWNTFLGAVRTSTLIPGDIRELAISRVAVVNRAWYEWMHHAPLAVRAGVPLEAMDAVKTDSPLVRGDGQGSRARDGAAGLFTEKQWAALVLADEMTRQVQVSEDTMDWVKGLMSNREVVELVATVACYNCVSRFLVALDVGERNGTGPSPLSSH